MERAFVPVVALAAVCLIPGLAAANPGTPAEYPHMLPIGQYLMASADEEIALARTAAPPSIAADAEILVLGAGGYTTAVTGKNGYVCLVDRGWFAEFVNPVFWNPIVRGPDCLNPAAARTMLPHYFERTKWALAGLSIAQMAERTKDEVARKAYVLPEVGAMAFMLSKEQIVAPPDSHWHPHLMFFVANTSDEAFGANVVGSPVLHPFPPEPDPIATFLVPVRKWSDGTIADYAPPSESGARHEH